MLNRYKKSEATLFIRKAVMDMMKIKAELYEHRYCLEKNVESRTEHLLKRIALLESCNATLCNRLASANQELVALKQLSAHALPCSDTQPNDCAEADEIDHVQMEMSWYDASLTSDIPSPNKVRLSSAIRDAKRDKFATGAHFSIGSLDRQMAQIQTDPCIQNI
jgi:hypothetical protein